jgi:hypothetical protein
LSKVFLIQTLILNIGEKSVSGHLLKKITIPQIVIENSIQINIESELVMWVIKDINNLNVSIISI